MSLLGGILINALALLLCLPASGEDYRDSLKTLVYPIVAPTLSSKFGVRLHPLWKVKRHHDGIDLAVPMDTPIRAVASGIVVFADPYKGYGKLITIKHSGYITSHYGHCKTIRVKPGEHVSAGQIIGTVGKTGSATGPHLHFEIRKDGKALDPLKFLPGLTEPPQG